MSESHDPVNKPAHYTSHPSGIECIQVAEHFGFCVGNAIKYLWRAGLKGDAIEDLRKAEFYVRREIAKREREERLTASNLGALQLFADELGDEFNEENCRQGWESDICDKGECYDCKRPCESKCSHGGDPSECWDCMIEADRALDASRER